MDTVESLIKCFKKLPPNYKIQINVDNSYTSTVKSIYVDEYEKNRGRNVVTIKV